MLFLVEMDYVKSVLTPTAEGGKLFIENLILPTLDRAEQLIAEKRIIAGGPIAGRIALRFMVQADSSEEVDGIVSSIPLWSVSETKVTPLIGVSERRKHVMEILNRLKTAKG